MPFDTLTDDPVLQRFIAGGVFAGFVVVAVLLLAEGFKVAHGAY